MQLSQSTYTQQKGFTLIEILIALVLVMISVAGMIQVASIGLANTEDGRYKTDAAVLIQDLAERIRVHTNNELDTDTKLLLDEYATASLTAANCPSLTAASEADRNLAEWCLGQYNHESNVTSSGSASTAVTFSQGRGLSALPNASATIAVTNDTANPDFTVVTITVNWDGFISVNRKNNDGDNTSELLQSTTRSLSMSLYL